MSTGALTLTCLLACLGQVGQDAWYTSDRHFKIPLNVPAAERQEIKQLTLYESRDRGMSWDQSSVIAPDKEGFVVHAPADGEYWFRVAVVKQNGQQEPKDIFKAHQTTRVVIDTLKPNVRIVSAQRQGDEVVVRWEIQESNPDVKSLKLRYRPVDSAAAWAEGPAVPPVPNGELRVKVNTGKALTFRLEMKDRAGNFHYDETNVAGDLAVTSFQGSPPSPGFGQPVPLAPNMGAPIPVAPPAIANPPIANPPLPVLPPTPPPINSGNTGVPAPPYIAPVIKSDQQVQWESSSTEPSPLPPGIPKVPAPVATTPGSGFHHQANSAPAMPGARPLPPVQFVNKPEAVLQYELSKVGPAGIGSVELWLTTDDGQKWAGWQEDRTVSASMREGKYARTLPLPGEGVYGLAIVVRNMAGKGRMPQPGEAPEMRIEVDTTAPEAVLYKPESDPAKRDALVLMWDAKDKNLGAQPITLEWAKDRNGPWHTIQANLPNSGKHSWQMPPGVPVYVYLRVRVRDLAGNEGIAVTDQPQLADTSEPEGRLIGVSYSPAAVEKY